jgi:hypothetical protein
VAGKNLNLVGVNDALSLPAAALIFINLRRMNRAMG